MNNVIEFEDTIIIKSEITAAQLDGNNVNISTHSGYWSSVFSNKNSEAKEIYKELREIVIENSKRMMPI